LDEPLIEFVHEWSLPEIFYSAGTVPGQRAHGTQRSVLALIYPSAWKTDSPNSVKKLSEKGF
jgi:hypothetical protein